MTAPKPAKNRVENTVKKKKSKIESEDEKNL
jgi:hypothetical protein